MNGELEKRVADEARLAAALEAELAAREAAIEEGSENVASWQKTLAECDDAIRSLVAARDEARAELAAKAAGIAALEAAGRSGAAQAEPRGAPDAAAVHGVRAELEACRARISELEAARNDALAQLRAAKADLAERDATLPRLARARGAERHDAALALDERAGPTGAATAAAPFAGAERHLLFFQGPDGYELVERAGPPPAPGDVVEVEGDARVVARVGAAPTPVPKLPCAYLAA